MTIQERHVNGPLSEPVPERFVPDEMSGQLVAAEHLVRYTWAASFSDGRRVLDAGCGVGYGAEMLNRAGAAAVYAIDNSPAALELARASVSEGVTLEQGDVAALPYPDDSFDLVVCFEVIEHIEQPERVLDELARVLHADGLLLLSSPNRDRYVPGNPHHRHEYVRPELQAALDARFGSARIISQHVMLASVISWSASPVFDDAQLARVADPEPADETYLLAMAGSDLPPDPGPVVSLTRFAEPRRWLDHIGLQKEHIERQARWIGDLEQRDSERAAALDRLVEVEQELSSLRERCAELDEAREEVVELREKLASALDREAALEHDLETFATSKSWRYTAALRSLASGVRGRP